MNRTFVRAAALAAACLVATSALAVDPALRKQAKDPDSFKRSDAARALAKEGSADAAAIVADLFSDRSPYVRDAAVEACGNFTAADAVDTLAKAANSKDELTRRNVAAALGTTKQAAALAPLRKLARKDGAPGVRAAAFDALWEFKKDADALVLAKEGASDADPGVRAAAIEAAGRIGGDGAAAIVSAALTDADEGVRAVARLEMRFVAREEASAGLAAGAADPSWRVRAQIVDDAAWIRDAQAIDALVKLVGDPVQRVAASAHRVLQLLTGKELGRDADLWRAWWEQNRAAWKPPHGRLAELEGRNAAAPGKTSATYHGVEVASAGVAFVLDFSGSMRDPMSKTDARPRWEVAREELTRCLAALPDGTLANVHLFQVETKSAFASAAALSAKTRGQIEGLLRQSPAERGNLLDAMLTALRDDRIDTVFLLSDGAPSDGEMVDKSRVQAAIRALNRRRKAVVHTIAVGSKNAAERGFMEGVAREGGGRCVVR